MAAAIQAGDSGVETECDVESNDSMSSGSVAGLPAPGFDEAGGAGVSSPRGGGAAATAAPFSPDPPPPSASSPSLPPTSPLRPPPPPRDDGSENSRHCPSAPAGLDGFNSLTPMAAEDGYLGDCSSDGGNEKNFPLPANYTADKHRHSLPPSPRQQSDTSPPPPIDDIDPPAGLQFSALVANNRSVVGGDAGGGLGYGYHILGSGRDRPQHNLRTKIRATTGLRSKYNAQVKDDWSRIKAAITDRKLRGAASTNNTELVEQLCAGGANVRCYDDHLRSPLHFASAMGYSEVAEILLKYGADPNQKDKLGNTALHLAACTNHVPVVTLLLRAGTDITTIDNNGRTPMQLAQAKLKILQRNSSNQQEMSKVKCEVSQVLEMMREYLKKISSHNPGTNRSGPSEAYSQLIDSFSKRLNLHTSHSDLSNDLGVLLETLGDLRLSDST